MATDDLLQHLRDLEVALHKPDVRCDPARLDELLHDSFTEFGRSGRSYSRADILKFLSLEVPPGPIWSQDFTVAEISEDIALLTYKSAYIETNGELGLHTLLVVVVATHGTGMADAISPRYAHRCFREERNLIRI